MVGTQALQPTASLSPAPQTKESKRNAKEAFLEVPFREVPFQKGENPLTVNPRWRQHTFISVWQVVPMSRCISEHYC